MINVQAFCRAFCYAFYNSWFPSYLERAHGLPVAGASAKIAADRASRNYLHALEAVAGLRKYVDRFFQEVMVMAEDAMVRRNRLSLLQKLKREVSAIACLEEIGGEEAR